MAKEPSRNERIKEASNYLRGTLAEGLREEITGAIVEDDQQLVKFHGMYLQDDRDLRAERRRKKMEAAFAFMIRVRIPGGVLTPSQWLALDQIARDYGNGTMRITTRQTIQLHGVIKSNLKQAMAHIDAALLTTIAACGDVNRNVICNPNPLQSRAYAAAMAMARARLRPSPAAHAGLSRDLARRREDRRRRAGRRDRADLRRALSAAQVQDRGGGAAVERRRRVRARSRLHRHPRQAERRGGLQRHGRRRHGHDPWRARDLSAHRRRHGLLPPAGYGRRRRSCRDRAARLGRPLRPQARAAQIHHRGSRA